MLAYSCSVTSDATNPGNALTCQRENNKIGAEEQPVTCAQAGHSNKVRGLWYKQHKLGAVTYGSANVTSVQCNALLQVNIVFLGVQYDTDSIHLQNLNF